ncbi:hypothetical protein TSMEX_002326 [Taenia solium]|eukprot:TsM_000990600 transcript=TsM_000990600 gene=TsM_000990600
MKSLHFVCCITLFVVDSAFWAEARPGAQHEEVNDDLRDLQDSRSEMSLQGGRGRFSSGNISLEMAHEGGAGKDMVCHTKDGDVEDGIKGEEYQVEEGREENDYDFHNGDNVDEKVDGYGGENEGEEDEEEEDLGMPTLGYGLSWTGVFDDEYFDRTGDYEYQEDDGSASDDHAHMLSYNSRQECVRGDDGACRSCDISSTKLGPRAIDVSSYRSSCLA